ncbi:CBUA0020 family Dot/Icm T4SS effector [Coxiella burnetii]|uniref:Uncharacterized protein n=3 Tax=Coxiella burnetii TaxID=777 RepID=Q83A08_COXBU|nr:CBUA0020 family Dot/Icm T4SS effector [Coxiella burnetii]NP_819037.1 hypothetical protein CBUA0020 [Coxiella burnetii RSA 493]AAO91597.1 hypothetical protein CBUA0020 [Coxiella burnetii RSA 493]ARK28374.1 hypothetical protein BMW92_10600 [Coxiella burnetii]MCF2094056.1 CBUA0020 family Dot/Icm T4SS effector [Coxiella burnetii]MCF2096074.1 CBUA0020 family Dot/Icm T4SS effector [Coxiella burnetii]MCF2098067.1 CBUA0020 family Dot/Icm T4SS effector [Coxiella burnetii]
MNDDEKKKLLEAYQNAVLIEPPKELPPIFVTPQTSDEPLQNLAITLSAFPIENRGGVQVFEVPKIADDCRSYVGRGYDAYEDTAAKGPQGPAWKPDSTWVKLESIEDFACRKGFEKVYVYEGHHYARQWGDGTILEKLGSTHWGATPVVRLIDPHALIVKKYYGEVKEIWIRPYLHGSVPIPYLRAQSSYRRGPFGNYHLFKSVYKKEIVIQKMTKDDWEPHYQWAKKEQQRQQQATAQFFKPQEEKQQESKKFINSFLVRLCEVLRIFISDENREPRKIDPS